jgi:hypothetical protein
LANFARTRRITIMDGDSDIKDTSELAHVTGRYLLAKSNCLFTVQGGDGWG